MAKVIKIVIRVFVASGYGLPKHVAMDELRAALEHHNSVNSDVRFDTIQAVGDLNRYELAKD